MSENKKHPTKIPGWDGSLEQLARALANLRYDKLDEFLFALSEEIDSDSYHDEQRGRPELGAILQEMAYYLYESASTATDAWQLCEPHMKDELENES